MDKNMQIILDQISKNIGSTVKKSIAQNTKTPVLSDSIAQLPVNKPIGGNSKGNFFGKALKGLSKVAPVASQFIPGAGPLVSGLLSTLNDDEWFSEYKSSGAAFNELIVTRLANYPLTNYGSVLPRAAFALLETDIQDKPKFYELFMSSVLAYVRVKTNNVLVDNVSLYTDAVRHSMRMYAVYYTLEKWIKFSQKLPVNIPLATKANYLIAPETINQTVALRDTIKSFLQSSVRLPYALVQAIRWRYGTMFHAFNTGQPGFISYDLLQSLGFQYDDNSTFSDFVNEVKLIQTGITASGRAAADLKMAYDDHTIQYDVEESHYDEKEYNLRINMTVQTFAGIFTPYDKDYTEIIKDSRLAMSPAIQASLLSTMSLESDGKIPNSASAALEDYRLFILKGGDCKLATYVFNESISTTMIAANSGFRKILNGLTGISESIGYENQWRYFQISYNGESSEVINNETCLIQRTADAKIIMATDSDYTPTTSFVAFTRASMILALLNSLGFDHANKATRFRFATEAAPTTTLGAVMLWMDRVSYDYARINTSSVKAIQTAAIRNLTRGDYKQKSPDISSSQAIKDIASAAVETLPSV
jgi:hypothetical protein